MRVTKAISVWNGGLRSKRLFLELIATFYVNVIGITAPIVST